MRSSKLGRYILLLVGLIIVVGGWIALEATERQLRRMAQERERAEAPATAAREKLTEPRATGPLAASASGATGPVDPDAPPQPPPSESDAKKAVPPGAIW